MSAFHRTIKEQIYEIDINTMYQLNEYRFNIDK